MTGGGELGLEGLRPGLRLQPGWVSAPCEGRGTWDAWYWGTQMSGWIGRKILSTADADGQVTLSLPTYSSSPELQTGAFAPEPALLHSRDAEDSSGPLGVPGM